MANEVVPYHQQWYAQVPRSTHGATIGGYAILLLGVGGFFIWSALAPLDGAVISPGNFVATSQNKIIQHLEGGIIREILVKEGELVEEGQALMRLDETAAKAELSRLLLRKAQLTATVERIEAELNEEHEVRFSNASLTGDDGAVALVEIGQRNIFASRRDKMQSDIAIEERGIAALREDIEGDEQRRKAIGEQLAIIDEELTGKTELFNKGLIRKPEYFALKRARLNLEGEQSRIQSEIDNSTQRIEAAKRAIVRVRQLAVQRAAEDLQAAVAETKDVSERVVAGRAVLSRLEVKAPVRGVIVKMNYHTAGGVIRPGNDILALLPTADELIIEVNIRPQDIAHVKVGQESLVRLTAMNQRLVPMMPAKVIYVSPDALPNERKQHQDNIYIARVELDRTKVVEIKDFMPTPGMPAEVFIKTGERTFFQYLVKPVIDTMHRAFRES